MSAIVWQVDTAVWRQEIHVDGIDILLRRRYRVPPGMEGRPDTSLIPSAVSLAAFVTGREESGYLNYSLSTMTSLASDLWPTPPSSWGGRSVNEVFRGLGVALADLHRPTAPHDARPPQVTRFLDYCSMPESTPASRFLALLGESKVDQLKHWAESLPQAGVLSHGAWSLGSIFVSPATGSVEVVIGEELVTAHREFDLGWMLGELCEFEVTARRSGQNWAIYAAAGAALLDGYAEGAARFPNTVHPGALTIDSGAIARVVAVRVALHQCDFVESWPENMSLAAENAHLVSWLVDQADPFHELELT